MTAGSSLVIRIHSTRYVFDRRCTIGFGKYESYPHHVEATFRIFEDRNAGCVFLVHRAITAVSGKTTDRIDEKKTLTCVPDRSQVLARAPTWHGLSSGQSRLHQAPPLDQGGM